jgi:hypothetical protein
MRGRSNAALAYNLRSIFALGYGLLPLQRLGDVEHHPHTMAASDHYAEPSAHYPLPDKTLHAGLTAKTIRGRDSIHPFFEFNIASLTSKSKIYHDASSLLSFSQME